MEISAAPRALRLGKGLYFYFTGTTYVLSIAILRMVTLIFARLKTCNFGSCTG